MKRAAREADRPVVKKAKINNGVKSGPARREPMITKTEEPQTLDQSDALSESDEHDLDGENGLDEGKETSQKESRSRTPLKRTLSNGDGDNGAVNGIACPFQMYSGP